MQIYVVNNNRFFPVVLYFEYRSDLVRKVIENILPRYLNCHSKIEFWNSDDRLMRHNEVVICNFGEFAHIALISYRMLYIFNFKL